MGDNHCQSDSSDSDYVPSDSEEYSEIDLDMDDSDHSDSSKNNDNPSDNNSDSEVDETPEDGERRADILDQDDADDNREIIPTELAQSNSKEDDGFLDNLEKQSASEEQSEDLPGSPKMTQKARTL